jgi:hypothetical protein
MDKFLFKNQSPNYHPNNLVNQNYDRKVSSFAPRKFGKSDVMTNKNFSQISIYSDNSSHHADNLGSSQIL